MKYTPDFKLKVINFAQDNSLQSVEDLYKVTRKTVRKWISNYNQSGDQGLKNKSRKEQKHPLKIALNIRKKIIKYKEDNKTATLREIKKKLNLSCSLKTISNILPNLDEPEPNKFTL